MSTANPSASSHLDPAMLERIRALLAKAESTTFEAEAEALTAKAQELMARYAIDEALLHGIRGGSSGGPLRHVVPITSPYASQKGMLLGQIASANRCQAVWPGTRSQIDLIGYPADIEATEILFTSLLVQATTAMVATGSHIDRAGRSRTRSFRTAFLVAFAERIGQRLRETTETATTEAAALESDVLPVLAARSAEVDRLMAELFPRTTRRRVTVSNAGGYAAGRAAADRAELGGRRRLPR